jgi:hypothetical protein
VANLRALSIAARDFIRPKLQKNWFALLAAKRYNPTEK